MNGQEKDNDALECENVLENKRNDAQTAPPPPPRDAGEQP